MKRSMILLGAALLFLSSCSGWAVPAAPGGSMGTPSTQTPSASEAPLESALPTQAPPPIQSAQSPGERPDPVWVANVFTASPAAEDGTVIFQANIELPQIENTAGIAAYEAINAYYDDVFTQYRADMEERIAWATDDYVASAAAGLPFAPNTEHMSFELTFQNSRGVSILRTLEATGEGGADRYLMAESFALDSGRRLALADCFSDPEQGLALVKQAIQAQASKAPEGVEAAALDAAFVPEHFYLAGQGLVFWYQAGDLAQLGAPLLLQVDYQTLEGVLAEWIGR